MIKITLKINGETMNESINCSGTKKKSEIMQYLFFCVCLITINIMSSRFIHVVTNGRFSCLFKAEYLAVCVFIYIYVYIYIQY